jgi:glutamate synthase domain-containing protein 2
MATNKKFNVRHGLSAGTGATQRDIVSDVGEILDVGVLTNLTTVTRTSVVAAINEINDGNAKIDDVIALAIALG